jgi:hypothetical protein
MTKSIKYCIKTIVHELVIIIMKLQKIAKKATNSNLFYSSRFQRFHLRFLNLQFLSPYTYFLSMYILIILKLSNHYKIYQLLFLNAGGIL